jgi:hypothetical protein
MNPSRPLKGIKEKFEARKEERGVDEALTL